MDTPALLADLRARGLRLVVDGERLLCSPARLISEQDRAAIAAAKPSLLALLEAESLETRLRASGLALQARWASHGHRDPEATRMLDDWLALLGRYERIAPLESTEAEWKGMAAAMRAVP